MGKAEKTCKPTQTFLEEEEEEERKMEKIIKRKESKSAAETLTFTEPSAQQVTLHAQETHPPYHIKEIISQGKPQSWHVGHTFESSRNLTEFNNSCWQLQTLER